MKVALIADTHLGYSAGKLTVDGVNLREQDGYDAFRAIVDGIIAADVDAVVHGGDLFHTTSPSIRSIVEAHAQLRRLVNAGIPVFMASGNHDTSDILSEIPATASVEEPGVNVVEDREGTFELTAGLRLFVVSHRGVADAADIVHPVDGDVNILLSHASVVEDGVMLHTENAPREKVLADSALELPWSAVLLGHIHNRHFVKGRENVLYAGSSLRRGFSDAAGERGWTEVEVSPSGLTTFTHHDIWQRPQFDLGVVDGSGKEAGTVADEIVSKFENIPDASIVRLLVRGVSPAVRRSVPSKGIAEKKSRMLESKIEWEKVATVDKGDDDEGVSAGEVDFGDDDSFARWANRNAILETLDEETKTRVVNRARRYVHEAREQKLANS